MRTPATPLHFATAMELESWHLIVIFLALTVLLESIYISTFIYRFKTTGKRQKKPTEPTIKDTEQPGSHQFHQHVAQIVEERKNKDSSSDSEDQSYYEETIVTATTYETRGYIQNPSQLYHMQPQPGTCYIYNIPIKNK